MIRSRVMSRAHTTIPEPVRKALRLKEGDLVVYRIKQGRVIMPRVEGNG